MASARSRTLTLGAGSALAVAWATPVAFYASPARGLLPGIEQAVGILPVVAAFAMAGALAVTSERAMHSKQSNAGTRWAALCILAIVCGSHLPSAEALVREPAAPAAARAPAGPVPGGQRLSLSRGLRSPNKQFLRGGETLIDPELGATAHMKQPADVLKMAGVDPKVGLSEERVAEIRAIFGSNVLPSKEKVPLWKRFLEQFDDKMVKILLAAAGISTVFAVVDYGTEAHPFVEPAVIMSILILNAVIGVWQESSAEAAIDALATFNPDQAKVLRSGTLKPINAADLVPGDIVEIAVGDKVPADVRVIESLSTTLKVEQAALTGEAASVNKDPNFVSNSVDDELAQKENIMFSATDLVYGKCKGVVIKTGAETEIGKIAQALAETEDQESPLKQKLDKFGDLLTNVITVICIACWVVNIKSFGPKGMALTGKDTVDWRVWSKGAMHFFKIAIVLAVAAIPEGLPAVVTTCLALGTGRMAKRNALVRHLPAVETLGCTSIICSDKTGTLTTNQMSVQKILMIEQGGKYLEMDVDGITYEPVGEVKSKGKKVTAADHASLNELCKVASLCNQSGLFKNAQGVWERLGESTEAALKVLAEKLGAVGAGKDGDTPVHDYWASKFKKFATLEFNRERKSMSVLVGTDGEDKGTLLVKGATEMVLQRCNKVRLADGSTIALSADMRKDLIKYVEEHYASGKLALRCLAHAVLDKKLSVNDSRLQDPKKFEEVESDLTFVGLTGILDPPREEVKGAIKNCKEAGIRVMVITGDNPKTAETICRMIGIFGEDEDTTGKSFTGKDFTRMTLDEKRKAVRAARLFSRTEPIHKKDIVELLQETVEQGGPGETAAMTGDGVNDAPALKAADIGVAMGSGTSVAQGAAKMVLADDNFTTIVGAVEEGRAIYANTKAFIRYLISSNIGEVVCVFLAVILGLPEVLSPVALLWVNLVTDGLPATALSFNPSEPGIMSRPPRRRDEQLVDAWMLTRYLLTGTYVGVATVWSYVWWFCHHADGPKMTLKQLRLNLEAPPNIKFANNFGREVFNDKSPGTVALSVLVTIEMFNALNAVTESKSLFSMPPWANPYLILAVAGSFAQHFAVLAWKPAEVIFHVKKLTKAEWKYIFALSAPIVLLEEMMKLATRIMEKRRA